MHIEALSGWTKAQKSVVVASFLGWTLDAFDYFLLVFVLKDIAAEFHTRRRNRFMGDVPHPRHAAHRRVFVRPRRRPLWTPPGADDRRAVLLASCVRVGLRAEPSPCCLIIRALFGVAMGGEWGIGASLTMETIPPKARGLVSGLLQYGYPTGYLIGSLVYAALFPTIGWRGMFMVGVIPALLVLYIRRSVPESPGWKKKDDIFGGTLGVIKKHWPLAIYAIVLMTAFNFFSHGTQDAYPTFLRTQHNFDHLTVSTILIVLNVGAIAGGLTFGSLSEWLGRRRTIIIAALLSLLVLPLWAFAEAPMWLGVGAFLMQFMVQGAWGVIPAHLNELSPHAARGTFPGFTYQLGNLFAAINLPLQTGLAAGWGGNYSWPLMLVAAGAAITIALLTAFGTEAKGAHLGLGEAPQTAPLF